MEQHLGRQAGVQKVHVSLIDGKVEITPKNDGKIDPVQILKATYDSGVSVAEMTMIARGQIIKNSNGDTVFQVTPSLSIPIVPNQLSQDLVSASWITVNGLLFKKTDTGKKQKSPTSLSVTILEIQKKE